MQLSLVGRLTGSQLKWVQDKQPSLKTFFTEIAFFIKGEQRLCKPWLEGRVWRWVYVILRVWSSWNSSFTCREIPSASSTCFNKEIRSLTQNYIKYVRHGSCTGYVKGYIQTRNKEGTVLILPVSGLDSQGLDTYWPRSCSRLATPVTWLCSPTMKGTGQGPLGFLKINIKGEMVGKLTVRISLTCLNQKRMFMKEMWKKVQIQSRR